MFNLQLTRVAFCSLLVLSASSWGSDIVREQRLADEIAATVQVGKVAWFNIENNQFIGLRTAVTVPQTQGAAIIAHDLGLNPDSPDVVFPLRSKLPDTGWTTLAIQMPLLAGFSDEQDYFPLLAEAAQRIRISVEILKQEHIANIALIGHGFGALAVLWYAADKPDPGVKALVLINLPVPEKAAEQNRVNEALGKVDLPLFDLYGGHSPSHIGAQQRLRAIAKKPKMRQLCIDGANHFFSNAGDVLVKRVYSWLMRVAPGMEVNRRKK